MKYDALFLTNLPNYYKINLFNEIAKECKIFVVFIASKAEQRNDDFNASANAQFDFEILNSHLQKRNILFSLLKLRKVILNHSSNHLILGEWVALEYWYARLFFKKRQSSMMLESSIDSISGFGLKELVKKIFLTRINRVFANGTKHAELAEFLGFKGDIINVRGLGIINYSVPKRRTHAGDFLYVGRLSAEKNLENVITAINKSDYRLTIVGEGPMESNLKELAGPNVSFTGYVPNRDLGEIYASYRSLLLISTFEPYGLVAEEAMYFGTPSIVSSACGIVNTLCFHEKNCLVIDATDESELNHALDQMMNEEIYGDLKTNCHPDVIIKKNRELVDAYVSSIMSEPA